jgi:metal transporter CNNM
MNWLLDVGPDAITWVGIVFCLSQSAMFSGLNLAFFSLSLLQLEVKTSQGNPHAAKVLAMRKDSNFLLTTTLWGSVSITVLLTLLSDSVMAGLVAFGFSTVFITLFGEILPQAYFSRNAIKMAAALSPVLRFYQWILFPVAKPSAMMLDLLLGREGINYWREQDLRKIIRHHVEADEAEVDHVEGIGALNFLAIDDIKVLQEGEQVNPESIIRLASKVDFPVIPTIERSAGDPFLKPEGPNIHQHNANIINHLS